MLDRTPRPRRAVMRHDRQPATGVGQADLDAARLLLPGMGITPADLLGGATPRPPAPTFAEYVPVVAGAVSAGTRRAYGTYWNRVVEHWGAAAHRRAHPVGDHSSSPSRSRRTVVLRRNGRGGRSAAEHLIAALRCLYRQAIADGYIARGGQPGVEGGRSRAGCPAPAGRCRTTGWRRSTRSPPAPATTRPWTPCCSGCTPRPHAAAAARWRCGRPTWTPTSA